MKQLLPIFLLFPAFTAFNQTAETAHHRSLWLGLSFSPDLAYRTTASQNDIVEGTYDKIEIPKSGYSGGVNVVFEMDQQIELEGGIQYSWKGFRTKEQQFTAGQPNDPFLPASGWFEHRYPYIDVPVKLNYKPFKNGKFFFTGGLIGHIYLQSSIKSVYIYSDGRKTEMVQFSTDDGYETFTAGIVAGFGRDFYLGKNSKFRVEPLFRHMFLPIHGGSVKYYLWSAGLNVGFYKRLR